MRLPVLGIAALLVLILLAKLFSHSTATNPAQPGTTSPVQGGALGGGSASNTTAQAGVFQGRCTTEQGTPLANVDVKIAGVTTAGENTVTDVHTDSSGNYSQTLPPGKYSILNAFYPVTLGTTNYLLPLAIPDGANNDDADIGPGIARDLVLHIHGKIAPNLVDTDWRSFYGGNLICTFYGRYLVGGTPAGSITEMTLVPSGPLADGTTGQTLTLRVTNNVTNEGTEANFLDIPIGQYTISARLLNADGSLIEPLIIGPVSAGQDPAPYKTSLEGVTFPPSNFTSPYPQIGQGTGISLLQLSLNDGSPGP